MLSTRIILNIDVNIEDLYKQIMFRAIQSSAGMFMCLQPALSGMPSSAQLFIHREVLHQRRKIKISAADIPSVSQSVFTITEKAPTRAFSWLSAPTSTFTFKTLLRHYAKQMLTPR